MSTTATLRARLGEQIEDYIIPGACNPPAAHRALGIDRSIGVLLPGNVVVRATPDGTLIEALDPQVMVTLTGRPELKPVAGGAGLHVSFRTMCGWEIQVGRLVLGGGRHPAPRVSLDIGAPSDGGAGTWAGLTAARPAAGRGPAQARGRV